MVQISTGSVAQTKVSKKRRNGRVADKIVWNDFEHQRFYVMARRAKYRKYFITRSPTGVRLAQIKQALR